MHLQQGKDVPTFLEITIRMLPNIQSILVCIVDVYRGIVRKIFQVMCPDMRI